MKKVVVVLFIVSIIMFSFVSALNININNPQEGQIFYLPSSDSWSYIDINVSTDELATCKVYPGYCNPHSEEMLGIACFYSSDVDLSTIFSKNHFAQVYYSYYNDTNPLAFVRCTDNLNQTFDKQVSFSFQYKNIPLVPEFGLIIGTLTVISGAFIFFLIRQR